MSEEKQASESPPSPSRCCAVARQIAEKTVEQWECHDVFCACEVPWHGDAPDKVVVAREFLRMLRVAEQVVASQFSSCAANGVLQSAVKSYQA